MIVLNAAARTLTAGTGLALASTGGQAAAQEPEQFETPSLSPTHKYKARPDAPVR
jgi:hypothetical protein